MLVVAAGLGQSNAESLTGPGAYYRTGQFRDRLCLHHMRDLCIVFGMKHHVT